MPEVPRYDDGRHSGRPAGSSAGLVAHPFPSWNQIRIWMGELNALKESQRLDPTLFVARQPHGHRRRPKGSLLLAGILIWRLRLDVRIGRLGCTPGGPGQSAASVRAHRIVSSPLSRSGNRRPGNEVPVTAFQARSQHGRASVRMQENDVPVTTFSSQGLSPRGAGAPCRSWSPS